MSDQLQFADDDILLGFDFGTDGASVGAFRASSLELLAIGTAPYTYSLVDGSCREQDLDDWREALPTLMDSLHSRLQFVPTQVRGIGIGAQMHGCVLCRRDGRPVSPGGRKRGAILWNDQQRGRAEADELASCFRQPIVTRHTVSRMRWFVQHDRPAWDDAEIVTVPSSYIGYLLTGVLGVGIGDASGMVGQVGSEGTLFPGESVQQWYALLPGLVGKQVPKVGEAGQILGGLHEDGARILGLQVGTPVAFPEGDQPIGMVASATVRPKRASISLGTSWVFNAVGTKPVLDQRGLVDSFRTSNGGHLLMSCLSSGCGVLDQIANLLAGLTTFPLLIRHAALTEKAQAAPAGSHGAIWLPFFAGEGLTQNSHPFGVLCGLTSKHTDPGLLYRAAIESLVQLLRIGHSRMDAPPIEQFSVYGGGSKNPVIVQTIADVFNATVRRPKNASEASTAGAALIAGYAVLRSGGYEGDFEDFVEERVDLTEPVHPQREHAAVYSVQNDALQAALTAAQPLIDLATHPFHVAMNS